VYRLPAAPLATFALMLGDPNSGDAGTPPHAVVVERGKVDVSS
jgi:hypothetical protein